MPGGTVRPLPSWRDTSGSAARLGRHPCPHGDHRLGARVCDAAYAWAAGLVDGEGSIGIERRSHRPGGRLVLTVVQKHPAALEQLRWIFGAGSLRWSPGYGERGRPRWDFRISNQKAAEALTLMRPYLVIKAEEADVAIEFQQNVRQGRTTAVDVVEAARQALTAIKQCEGVMPSVPA